MTTKYYLKIERKKVYEKERQKRTLGNEKRPITLTGCPTYDICILPDYKLQFGLNINEPDRSDTNIVVRSYPRVLDEYFLLVKRTARDCERVYNSRDQSIIDIIHSVK